MTNSKTNPLLDDDEIGNNNYDNFDYNVYNNTENSNENENENQTRSSNIIIAKRKMKKYGNKGTRFKIKKSKADDDKNSVKIIQSGYSNSWNATANLNILNDNNIAGGGGGGDDVDQSFVFNRYNRMVTNENM